ncbi:MAG: branched-chain amino acid ABC transporter permease [Thermodesulfobacteriota bacterium]
MDKLKKWHFKCAKLKPIKSMGLILLAVILLLLPVVVHSPYYIHLLIMVGINAVLAMTFILLFRTGLITIAVAAFWGIGAYASALLTVRLGLSFWLALPASMIITGITAFFFGYFLVRKSGIGFVIQTMVVAFIIPLVFGTFELFGGYVGIYDIPRPKPIVLPFLAAIKFTSKIPYYYLMLFLVLIVILGFSAFYAAWTGRAWRAIGLGPRLAASLGVNIFRYRLIAFVISSAAAGLMGSFYAHYYGSIVPSTFGPFKTIYVHVYAILGGIGFAISGPLIGSLILVIVPEMLRITKEVEPIFTGLLLILLAMFLPDGLFGLLTWHFPRLGENTARVLRWIKGSSQPSIEINEKRK